LDGGRLQQAVLAAVVGGEDDSMLGPGNIGVVELEPRHSEDDRVVAEARGTELDGLCVRTDLQLDGGCPLSDGTGQERTPIGDFPGA
jgi:hypothetical protein